MCLNKFSVFMVLTTISGLISTMAILPSNAQPSTNEKIPQQRCLPQTELVLSNVAVIYNTGSTNTPCYRIFVSKTGEASYVKGQHRGRGKISTSLIKKFYRDIETAEPLSQLPRLQCAKSVSFGSSTFVKLGAEESPDVSCAANIQGQKLYHDTTAIARALHV